MSSIEVDWNRYAEQYDAITMSGSNPAYLQLVDKVMAFFRELPIKKDSLVADLGCGTGNFTLPLAKMFPDSRFVIVDNSEIMLEKAEEKVRQHGLKNVDILKKDIVEDIPSIADKYSRPFSHILMIHSLYTVGGIDSIKPDKVLKDAYGCLDNSRDSRFYISDINRQMRTGDWIPYCLWHAYESFRDKGFGFFGSLGKTVEFFRENDQAKLANRYIDMQQKEGNYLICSLDSFLNMLLSAGFSKIYEKSDRFYRGRDNLVVAGK